MDHTVKHSIDVLGAGAILGTFFGYIPHIAALLALVWYVLQIITWFKENSKRKNTHTRRKMDRE